MPELSLEAIRGLSEQDLISLVKELLTAERKPVSSLADGALSYSGPGGRTLIEARRSGFTPLAGVSVSAIARQAAALGATRVEIYLTGAIDADRQAALERALDEVRRGTAVTVRLADSRELLDRLQRHPQIARKYFPSEAEAEAAAAQQQIPPVLVKLASAIAPKPRLPTPIGQYLRLAWTAAAIVLLVWLPARISPSSARCIASVGLGLIVLAVVLAQFFKPDRGTRPYLSRSVMDAVIPEKDEVAVRRGITTATDGGGALLLLLDTLGRIPAAAVRAGAQTALLLFLATSSLIYMLVWGLSPIECAAHAHVCRSAVGGLGRAAHIGDFTRVAVDTAFFVSSAPARSSRLVVGLISAQYVVSAVLLGTYAAFFGFTALGRAHLD